MLCYAMLCYLSRAIIWARCLHCCYAEENLSLFYSFIRLFIRWKMEDENGKLRVERERRKKKKPPYLFSKLLVAIIIAMYITLLRQHESRRSYVQYTIILYAPFPCLGQLTTPHIFQWGLLLPSFLLSFNKNSPYLCTCVACVE